MHTFTGIILIALLASLILTGCDTGYKRKSGNWNWVTHDEQFGKRYHVISEADEATFKVLDNNLFAMDKNNVYYQGKKVRHVNAARVEFIGGEKSPYFKDDKFVYCTSQIILTADPVSFQILEYPYTKDKNDVFCGTIPMMLTKEEMKSFKVTNEDKLSKNTIGTVRKNYFIELNPRYKWIDTINIQFEFVITGNFGTAKTYNKKFVGYNEIKTDR